MLSLFALLVLGFKLIVPPNAEAKTEEWLTEDTCKALYKNLYIGLNKAVGYVRSAVLLKKGFKAVAKAVAFLYLSIAFKFLGDRLTMYLGKISLTNHFK